MAWVVTAVAAAFEVGATAAVIATAVSEVGIAMSVVGAVTGSKELLKVGGILGLAGGVGSLAASSGLIGGAAADAGASVAGDAAANAGVTDAAGDALNQGLTNQATGGLATNVTDAVTDVPTTFSVSDPSTGITTNALGDVNTNFANPAPLTNANGAVASASDATGSAAPGAASAAPGTPGADTAAAPGTSTTGGDISGNDLVSNPNGGAQLDIPKPKPWEDPVAWYKSLSPQDQSRVSTGLLQAGGQAVGGISSYLTNQQKIALQQQLQDQQVSQYNTAKANASSVPTISFKPVGLVAKVQGAQ